MAWVTVRNKGESYLYTYLRSSTGTTGEYPLVLPVPRVPTITVNLLEILRENSLPVLPDFHRYHRSRPVLPIHPPVLPLVPKLVELSTATGGIYAYQYYRLFTDTTDAPRHKIPL
jgi:hypothetical protein